MLKTQIREKENFDDLFKRFKREVAKCGVLQEVKKRVAYQKPSQKRKAKQIAARKKH
jgi:small subunit ribosomal protein S21